MGKKMSLSKLVGVAVSAATLLALVPAGVANAAQDVPGRNLEADKSQTITINGADSAMKGHEFTAVRVGNYQSASINDADQWSNVSVGTQADVLTSAEAALAATKPADNNDAQVGYEGNPIGEITSEPAQQGDAPFADTGTQTLREFVTNLSGDADFNKLIDASTLKTTAAGGKAEFSGLTTGVYVIKDTTTINDGGALGEGTNGASRSIPMLVATGIKVADTQYSSIGGTSVGVVNVKNSMPSVTKKVTSSKSVSVGDTLDYELTSAVPVTTGFSHYTFVLTDTPSDGLQFVADSPSIKVGGKVLDADQYKIDAPQRADDNSDTKYVNFDLSKSIRSLKYNDPIVITYKMKVTTKAVTTADGKLTNKVQLSYSNNPDKQPTTDVPEPGPDGTIPDSGANGGTTVTDPVTDTTDGHEHGVHTRKIELVSKAKADGHNLTGTTFQVFNGTDASTAAIKFTPMSDGEYVVNDGINDAEAATPNVTVASGSVTRANTAGRLTLKGLGDGTYTVKQTVAAQGFESSPKSTFTVTVSGGSLDTVATSFTNTGDTWGLVSASADTADFADDGSNAIVVYDVTTMNQLPLTGGAGIILGVVVAAILIAAAGGMYIFKRRQDGAAVAGSAKIIR